MALAKYNHPTHKRLRRELAEIVAAGLARCAEPVCLMPDRAIRPGDPWHLSHDPTGTFWIGPSHRRCNLAEANARRAAKRRRWAL